VRAPISTMRSARPYSEHTRVNYSSTDKTSPTSSSDGDNVLRACPTSVSGAALFFCAANRHLHESELSHFWVKKTKDTSSSERGFSRGATSSDVPFQCEELCGDPERSCRAPYPSLLAHGTMALPLCLLPGNQPAARLPPARSSTALDIPGQLFFSFQLVLLEAFGVRVLVEARVHWDERRRGVRQFVVQGQTLTSHTDGTLK